MLTENVFPPTEIIPVFAAWSQNFNPSSPVSDQVHKIIEDDFIEVADSGDCNVLRGCLQTVKTPCRLSLKITEIKTFIHIHYPRIPHPVPGHCKAPPYPCLASPFHSSSIDFASRPVKRLVPYCIEERHLPDLGK